MKRYGPSRYPGQSSIKSRAQGQRGELRFALRLAEVTRVDYERFNCDIRFITGSGEFAKEVPISAAYWSKRSFLGVMPEEGAIAVVGNLAAHQNQGVRPMILTFLPNGFRTALRYDPFGLIERGESDIAGTSTANLLTDFEGTYGPTRHKFRKLYPGELYGTSAQGAEIILDSGVRLLDKTGMEFWLRGEDQKLMLSSMDSLITTSASCSSSGRIIRSALTLPPEIPVTNNVVDSSYPLFSSLVDLGFVQEDGTLVEDINALPYLILPNGNKQVIITENGVPPDRVDARFFSEQRTELYEFAQESLSDCTQLDVDVLLGLERTKYIEKVLGTLVGNDPYTIEGRMQYGKLLRPVLFETPSSTTGIPRLEVVPNTSSEREKSLVGASLYRMRRPDGLGDLFLAHDKEGHVFLSIPASTSKASNLGAGRSVEADIKGSSKIVMGANKNERASLDLYAQGGFRWSLGTLSAGNQSLDVTSKGGLSFDIKNPDANGNAIRIKTVGAVTSTIDGSVYTNVGQDHTEEATGLRSISAEGLVMQVGTGDMQTNVVGQKIAVVSGTSDDTIGSGKKVTINGTLPVGADGYQINVNSGNMTTTFAAPAVMTNRFLTSGTFQVDSPGALNATFQSATSANFAFTAPTGTYSVSMGSGTISLTAGTGAITLTAGTSVNITASSIGLTGSVGLGNGASAPLPVIGGVPGPSPHIDYIVGIPLTGNPLVRTV